MVTVGEVCDMETNKLCMSFVDKGVFYGSVQLFIGHTSYVGFHIFHFKVSFLLIGLFFSQGLNVMNEALEASCSKIQISLARAHEAGKEITRLKSEAEAEKNVCSVRDANMAKKHDSDIRCAFGKLIRKKLPPPHPRNKCQHNGSNSTISFSFTLLLQLVSLHR